MAASGLVFGTPGMLRRAPTGFMKGFRGDFWDTCHSPKVSEGGSVGGFEGGIRQGFGTTPKGFSGHAARSEGLRKGVLRGGTSRRGSSKGSREGLPEGFLGGRPMVVRLEIDGSGLNGEFGPGEQIGRFEPSDRRSTAGMRRASFFFREYQGGVDAWRWLRNTPAARPADSTRSARGKIGRDWPGEPTGVVG